LDNTTEILKGLLEGCVLEIISRGETYGYQITQTLRTIGFSDVVEGTVYAILVRLEKNGSVTIRKKSSAVGPPRKFYNLTVDGHRELQLFWDKWDFVSSKINELRSAK
jgi:DNA-binding PadR family transcriptional regulator